MEKNKIGQYGKRNPLFMYQCAAGYSIKASPVKYSAKSKREDMVFDAAPGQSGTRRCGMVST
ncbi:hypothetical protein [uncultured Bacteroides sp.]|uniref:hypothetical protein n=1 Tax=uncultured Bacteroides sp. TaxID=162156 RepID=UPI00259A9D1F|nr:hypothetical protein [uncultured Bacteroides sp.]